MAQPDQPIQPEDGSVALQEPTPPAPVLAPVGPPDLPGHLAAPPLGPDRSDRGEAERLARRALRGQIARLERELSEAVATAFPHADVPLGDPVRSAGPRLLALGDLELLRDRLADRVAAARSAIGERAAAHEHNRVLLERMLLEPGRYKFMRIAAADVGERGCGHYEVRPRLGIIGMLAGWWQVKLSSGGPLAGGPRRRARPRIDRRLAARAASCASARARSSCC